VRASNRRTAERQNSARVGPAHHRGGRYAQITLDMMRGETGPDLYANQFATLADVSVDKVQDWCRDGYVKAVKDRGGQTGTRFQWRIPYAEARRWLKDLRVLDRNSPTTERSQLDPGALSTDQLVELVAHLGKRFSDESLRNALSIIVLAFRVARVEIDDPWPLAEARRHKYRTMSQLVEIVSTLQQTLADEENRPLPGMGDFSWETLGELLSTLRESAEIHKRAHQPPKASGPTGRGRCPLTWREDLIATVRGVYPLRAGKHFEDTVGLLLQYLGCEVEDLHGAIIDSLKRRREPPFRMATTKPSLVVVD